MTFSPLSGFHGTVRWFVFCSAFDRTGGFKLPRGLYHRVFGSDDSHPRLVLAMPDREIVRGL